MNCESASQRDHWFDAILQGIKGIFVDEPDICPAFWSQLRLEVSTIYGLKKFMDYVEPVEGESQPIVSYSLPSDLANSKFTLIMTDPDAPSRAKPIYREFIHWMVNMCVGPAQS